MSLSLNGNDTIQINGRLLTQFFDKDYGVLTYPQELANFKVGKNQNTAICFLPGGLMADLTLRLLVGTYDDQFINAIQGNFIFDAPSFSTLYGQIVKRSGTGVGGIPGTNTATVRNIIYNLAGGVPVSIPDSHSNSDGDEEQAAAIWKFKFALAPRQII